MNREPPSPRLWKLWLRGAVLLPLLACYLTTFWGHFGAGWPAPVRQCSGSATRLAWRVYHRHVAVGANIAAHQQVLWLATSVMLAGVVPMLLTRLVLRREWRDIGLAWPNRWGRRIAWLAILVVVPFAYLFAGERLASPRLGTVSPWLHLLVLIGVSLPEHIFLTGICVAAFLPSLRFPRLPELAPVEGTRFARGLRWLGLAQPSRHGDSVGPRVLAWWGLDGPALGAILTAGLLFGLVHTGARPIELAASFPGGIALCYLAYRSGSIWPGWFVHLAQMLLVAFFILVRRGA